jgi:hypothetical protein
MGTTVEDEHEEDEDEAEAEPPEGQDKPTHTNKTNESAE